MKHTLGTASKATGKAKSTILRAIKNGTISASRHEDGHYEIDPSELHRVFDPIPGKQVTSNDVEPLKLSQETLQLHLDLLEQERTREREQLQATIDDLRKRLDNSESRITALLSDRREKPRRWWQRIK